MHTNKARKITTQSLLVFTLTVLIMAGTFNTTISSFNRIGFISLMIILGIANILLIRHFTISKQVHKQHAVILVISLVYILINLLGLFYSFNARSLITLGQFIALIGFFILASLINWNQFRINIVRKTAIIYIFVTFLIWVSTGFSVPFKGFYENPNLTGIFIFLMLFFGLLDGEKKKANASLFVISLLIVYSSGSRSVFLAVIFFLFTYIIWHYISKNRIRFISYMIFIIALLLSFIFVYPKLIFWSKFQELNNFVVQYTGKNLYSGREIIWSKLLEKINEMPLLGHGTGLLPGQILDNNLSSHNFYLQIAFQNGYLGLFVFLLLLISIWISFIKNKKNYIVRLSASFFVAVLIYLSFEVSLTQNQIASGIIMWFIFSIGFSFVLNKNKN